MESRTSLRDATKRRHIGKSILTAAGALLLVVGAGAPAEAGWSRDGSSSTSYSSSSSGSWSGSGPGSSGTEKCTTSTANLGLKTADCLKCHPGSDNAAVNAERHHNLIKPPTNMQCLNCHQMVETPPGSGTFLPVVIRDCIVCHTSAVHNTVTHCVVDTCSGCHPGSLPQIHSGGGSSSGSWSSYHSGSYGSSSTSSSTLSSCYLCHTSRDSRVQQTILKGLAGQTISCDDCHGGGR